MAENMEVDTPARDTNNEGPQLRKRGNFDEESLQPILAKLERFITDLSTRGRQLLECFKKYKTENLKMRHFYRYAVLNNRLTRVGPLYIEFWYFWTRKEAKLHIELEEHLSSSCLITHESSVDSVMEKLDMRSAELEKFGRFPKELIRSCVLRRILHKKWLNIKPTMKAFVEKTADLYTREPIPTEDLLTYLDKWNLLTGQLISESSYKLEDHLTRWLPGRRYAMNEDIYMIIMEYARRKIDKEKMLQKIEDYCEGFIKNRKYLFESWRSGYLYCHVHKEVTQQKQKMENSAEYSEGKGTYDNAEWIRKEIQMVIERNESDEDVKEHRKSFFDDAMSRWQSLLEEGNTYFSNKGGKSSHSAKPPLHGIVGRPEDLFHRLSKATSEINSMINIIDEKIRWLSFMAGHLEICVGKVICTSKEIFEVEDDENYVRPDLDAPALTE